MDLKENLRKLGLVGFYNKELTLSMQSQEDCMETGKALAQGFLKDWPALSEAQRKLLFCYLEDLYTSNDNCLNVMIDGGFLKTLATELSDLNSEQWHPHILVKFLGVKTKERLLYWFHIIHDLKPNILLEEPTNRYLADKYQMIEYFVEDVFPEFRERFRGCARWHMQQYAQPVEIYLGILADDVAKNFKKYPPSILEKIFRFIEFFEKHSAREDCLNPIYKEITPILHQYFLADIYYTAFREVYLTRQDIAPYLSAYSKQYLREEFTTPDWDNTHPQYLD